MQSEGLPRSISSADLTTTERCREYVCRDYQPRAPEGGTHYFTSTPAFTLVIPALTGYNEGFREFFYRRIIDHNTKNELEGAKCLNYCRDASELNPMYTSGDGNCLLHAASLGMWGFQDRTFILRKAVSGSVINCHKNSLRERWRMWRETELRQLGTVLEGHQWENEWQQMVRYTSDVQNDFGMMEGLDQFHIFVLANVLRRPIIVFAVPKIRSVASGSTLQRLDFHGLYLPLLWDPASCKKGPLPIAFRNGHYSALAIIDNPKQYKNGFLLVPVFDSNGYDLPVRFTKQHMELSRDCRRAYLNLVEVWYEGRPAHCAKLEIPDTPAYLQPLLDGFITKCNQAYRSREFGQPPLGQPMFTPCRSGCGQPGDPSYNGYCLNCYQVSQKKNLQQNSSSAGSLKCGNNCNNPGRPEFLGMCQTCYRQQQQQPQGRKQTPPPGMAGNAPEPVSRNCPTPGCGFFGSVETNYYCSSCFKKNMKQIYEQQEASTGRGHSRPSTSPVYAQQYPAQGQKCTVCWQSIGVPEYGGICQQCHSSGTKAKPRQLCPRCHNSLGSLEYQGLCFPCFKKEAQQVASEKCLACRKFHGSPEYGGLCHTCFLEKTKSDQGHGRNQLNGPSWGSTQDFGDGSHQRVARSNSMQDGRLIHPSTAPQGLSSPSREKAPGQACIACNPHLPLDTSFFTICHKHASFIRSTLSVLRDNGPSQMSASPPVPIGVEPANADPYGMPVAAQPPYKTSPKKPYQPSPPARHTSPAVAHFQGASAAGGGMPVASSSTDHKPVKMLCNIPGCSFLGEQRLNGLCQDCYDESYVEKRGQQRSPYNYS